MIPTGILIHVLFYIAIGILIYGIIKEVMKWR